MSKININKPTDIDAIRRTNGSEVQQTEKGNALPGEKKITPGGDKLNFSGRAAEVGNLVEQVKELPDIREVRVQEVQEKIAAGDFNPTNEEIADAVIKEEG